MVAAIAVNFFQFVLIAGWGIGSGGSPKSNVLELDDVTFSTWIHEHPHGAVLFYAPWCFYSQKTLPQWNIAAKTLLLQNPPVRLAKIDAHRYADVADNNSIVSFPTIKLFVSGVTFEYDANTKREWQNIVNWVNKHLNRNHVLKTVQDVDDHLQNNELSVIALFAENYTGSTFAQSATHFDNVAFAESRDVQVVNDLAAHLSQRATNGCISVTVEQSNTTLKIVSLPRMGMECSDKSKSLDMERTFEVSVEGRELKVQRTNVSEKTWHHPLWLTCCDKMRQKLQDVHISVPSIVMFMPHDEGFAIYNGSIEDVQQLDFWVNSYRTPIVNHLNLATMEKMLDAGSGHMPVLFLISDSQHGELEAELIKAAQQLRGRMLLCFAGISSPIERRLADLAGADEGSFPVVTLIEALSSTGPYHTARKFRMTPEGLKAEHVINFMSDFEHGKLVPWLRSEPLPSPEESMPERGVGVLVGKNFVSTVSDPAYDVMVDFHAPWCGHCRKFEPTLNKLARRLQHVKTLKIMKFDATRNEADDIVLTGFPTVVIFPAGTPAKPKVVYHGHREIEHLIKWLHVHCTVPFEDRPSWEVDAHSVAMSSFLDPSEEDL